VNAYLITFLIAMVPIVELRGAIPVGVVYGLDPITACIIAMIGNMVPVPIIYLFARKVLIWGSKRKHIGGFFRFFLEKGEKGGKKLMEKAGNGSFWALAIFVGIPLPGTGAWTGTLAASILDMGFKKSVIACVVGVAIAGAIISTLTALGLAAILGLGI
jgi:uncharacterized membrane protein